MRRFSSPVRSLGCALLLGAAACADRAAATFPAPAPPVPAAPEAVTLVQCTVSPGKGTLACGPSGPRGADGPAAVILGGQGTNVRLVSAGTKYDSATATLRSTVTVENLTGQVLGSTDGWSASASGVRVFFASGPTVTVGTGAVSVANADGQAVFTGSSQPFFQYDGILLPGDTTAGKEWRFSVPASVTTFVFSLYVSAPVRSETGWIAVRPLAPTLAAGDTMRLSSRVMDVTGRQRAGESVTWSTSDPSVATVSATGLVTAVRARSALITATGGSRSGRVTVVVNAGGGPTVSAFDILPNPAFAGGDTVRLRATVRGFAGTEVSLNVLRPDIGLDTYCTAYLLSSSVAGDPVYECVIAIAPGTYEGAWRIASIGVPGTPGRTVTTTELLAAGAPAFIEIRSATQDHAAPVITEFYLSPDTVRAGIDVVETGMWMSDQGTGGSLAVVWFRGPRAETYTCIASLRSGTRHDGHYACVNLGFPDWALPGTWTIEFIETRDFVGNKRRMTTADLQAAGFRPWFVVANANPDLEKPTITGFSFSPSTVKGNGVDSVEVTLSATDTRSQLWFLDMEFENAAKTQTRRCLLNTAAQVSLTMRCAQRFTAADVGAWHVLYIRAIDLNGNERVLFEKDLRSASYPADLTVTP